MVLIKLITMAQAIQRINPAGLHKNPAFSQAVVTNGAGKTIYIGGQNAVDENAALIGKGDIVQQTEQVMKNLQTALKGCGATFEDLVKLSIFLVDGQDLMKAFQASQKFLNSPNPPAVTVLMVSGLGNPDFLLEIEATAFLAA